MSLGNDIKNDVAALEERMEELTIRQNYSSAPGTVNGIDAEINGFNNLGTNYSTFLFSWIFAVNTNSVM